MNKRDYYEVLGVDKSATKAEIKKAYRKLAKEFHPDRNKAADAEDKFKEVKEAYEILSDEQKRSAYDQYGFAGTAGFSGAGGGGGFDGFNGFGGFCGNGSGFAGFENMGNINDIFEQFFGSGFGGFEGFSGNRRSGSATGQNAQSQATRGADLEVNLKISFMDAVFGSQKTIRYKKLFECDKCKGTGAKNGTSKKKCSTCDGQGQVIREQRAFMLGTIRTVTTCPDCNGTGEIIKEKCIKCKGEGRFEDKEEFSMKIPPGTPDGITLKFRDRGNAGQKGGNAGDLYINIEVEPDDRFERRGNDIYSNIIISAVDATLGGEFQIPTVHGDLKLKIPSGTQPGKIFKLTDQGGPKFQGNGNGDQYVQVVVKIPEKLSKDEKRIWEELKN